MEDELIARERRRFAELRVELQNRSEAKAGSAQAKHVDHMAQLIVEREKELRRLAGKVREERDVAKAAGCCRGAMVFWRLPGAPWLPNRFVARTVVAPSKLKLTPLRPFSSALGVVLMNCGLPLPPHRL